MHYADIKIDLFLTNQEAAKISILEKKRHQHRILRGRFQLNFFDQSTNFAKT